MKNDLVKASEFTTQLGNRMSKLYELHTQLLFQKNLIEEDFSETLGVKVELKISDNALFHVVLLEQFYNYSAGTEWGVAEALKVCYDNMEVTDI